MTSKEYEVVIKTLIEKIDNLESQIMVKNYQLSKYESPSKEIATRPKYEEERETR